MTSIEAQIQADEFRMSVLKEVAKLHLPECLVAAGFVRNLVWDNIHGYASTQLNDVDVIYFDIIGEFSEKTAQAQLERGMPEVKWQVKNQAKMHVHHGHLPYRSVSEAMSFWPEKETAVGVRLTREGDIEVVAPFGIDSLLQGKLTHNKCQSLRLFEQRIERKQWLKLWPKLALVLN